jgi:aminoglycoside 2'-N-acetyltransferase I
VPKPRPTDPTDRPRRPRLRRLSTAELTATEVAAIRAIMEDAFGQDEDERFTDDDWEHAVGGVHVVVDTDGEIVTHASVVERTLHVGDRPFRTGYVEAVATAPAHQGSGYGTLAMTDVTALVRERFELGCLGTGRQSFYGRLGWQTWRGRSFLRTPGGLVPTPDDDGYLMVLSTPSSPPLDLSASISCEWRPGDVW